MVIGRVALLFVVGAGLLGCGPSRYVLRRLSDAERIFHDHTGFLLYDPSTNKTLIDYQGSTYFTPASNTKIFTFYAGLQLLGDSVPALRYVVRNDSLIFWGTGDPSFLYPEVYQNNRTYDFLKNSPHKLYFSGANFDDEHLGPGWAWDDYRYSYSPERSPFPIAGNTVTFTCDSLDHFSVAPPLFRDSLIIKDSVAGGSQVNRALGSNEFTFSPGNDTVEWQRTIPFHYSTYLLTALLADTLNRPVESLAWPFNSTAKTFYSIPADSLFKVMMQESDNFVAEQLLLLYSGLLNDTLRQQTAIDSVKAKYLFDLPNEPQWVDGSGLSRYNLFTPASIVRLWEKIADLVPQERLFELLAVGGVSGTIKNHYGDETPFVYGKTGTLSNNHCLSGFIITKNDRRLIFSLMNSNYTVSTSEIRKMMADLLVWVREKY